jgi:hypothetical protein
VLSKCKKNNANVDICFCCNLFVSLRSCVVQWFCNVFCVRFGVVVQIVLNIIGDYLRMMKYPFERVDGGVTGNERQRAIDRFMAPDSDRFVFLLTTRAGGVGINLTAADVVIIFDSDWNPQSDLQVSSRIRNE